MIRMDFDPSRKLTNLELLTQKLVVSILLSAGKL